MPTAGLPQARKRQRRVANQPGKPQEGSPAREGLDPTPAQSVRRLAWSGEADLYQTSPWPVNETLIETPPHRSAPAPPLSTSVFFFSPEPHTLA